MYNVCQTVKQLLPEKTQISGLGEEQYCQPLHVCWHMIHNVSANGQSARQSAYPIIDHQQTLYVASG